MAGFIAQNYSGERAGFLAKQELKTFDCCLHIITQMGIVIEETIHCHPKDFVALDLFAGKCSVAKGFGHTLNKTPREPL